MSVGLSLLRVAVVLLLLAGALRAQDPRINPNNPEPPRVQPVLGVSLYEENAFPAESLRRQKTSHALSLGFVWYGSADEEKRSLRWGRFWSAEGLFGVEERADEGGFSVGLRLGKTFSEDPWQMLVQTVSLDGSYRADWDGGNGGFSVGLGVAVRLMNHWSWSPVNVAVLRHFNDDDADDDWSIRIGFLSFLLPLR